jgi:nitroreductase|tara:strand:- start:61 stop:669 length:609 start_codon:yes stop_codon:yes gene_type:complete
MENAMKKPAPSDYDVLDVIRDRWSPHAFDPDREVPEKVVRSLLEAIRWSPSARNEQPWRILVLDSSVPEAKAHMESCLNEGNVWAKRAPLFLLAIAKTLYTETREPNLWCRYDVGAAVLSAVLQATSMGLVARQIGGFDRVEAQRLLEIPEGFEPATLLPVGYFGGLENLTDEQVAHDKVEPRMRRTQDEFVFCGKWGSPYG